MLKLINTKLLIAILAALGVIASAAIYQNRQTAKAAAILEQQLKDAEQRKQEDEAFRKKVKETGSATTQPLAMKARPGRSTSPSSLGRPS
jgi:hypothetical protein